MSRRDRRASEIAASKGLGIPGLTFNDSNDQSAGARLSSFKQRVTYPQVSTPSVNGGDDEYHMASASASSSARSSRERDAFQMHNTSRQSSSEDANMSYTDGHMPSTKYEDDEDEDRFLESVRRENEQGSMPLLSTSNGSTSRLSPSPFTTPKLGGSASGQFGSPASPFRMNGSPNLQASSSHRKKNSATILEMMAPSSPRSGSMPRGGNSWKDFVTGRRRLHPWTLLPAFLLGLLLATSGILGHKSAATLRNSLTSLTSSSSSLSSSLSSLPRPAFVSHPSGHLYMDQVRTSLGAIDEHPIYNLIANATARWNALLNKQSKTLAEAAQEYRARYNRHPPKGFEAWYEFATERNVVLIDEYDQIHRDIQPFLSLSTDLLHRRIDELETNPFTHTFVVRNGKIEITGAKADLGRAKDQAGLMDKFVHLLPDVNITMSAHDGPSILVDWDLKNKHRKAAIQNTKLTEEQAESVNDSPAHWGWNLACPPDSRLRNAANGMEIGAIPVGPSFVEDHLKTMDMCQNPEWQYLHGFTDWAGPRPRTLSPLFSFAKTTMHSDILCVPLEQFVNTPTSDPAWEDKKFAKIIWRGSMTGVWYDRQTFWRSSQRSRLHFLSQATEGSRYVRFVDSANRTHEKEVDLVSLNQRYLDAGYVGKLQQCTPDDGGCEAIPAQPEMETVKGMDWESQNDYKYIVDTDGNAWSGRFHRLMASNSLVLKSTIFPEWYSDRIMPWVHYVPLKIDYTDLYDLMAFFSGDMEGKDNRDHLAKQIAYQGKEWTEKHWRWEDMEAYAFRLYLEWARVANRDQTNVDYLG